MNSSLLTLKSVVVLLAILLSVSSVSSLPYRDLNRLPKGSEDRQNKPVSPKPPLRHLRETSETVPSATTTPSLPPTSITEPATEEGPRCDESTRVQNNCKNLKETLMEYFGQVYAFPYDTFFNSFTLDDIRYFNLLGDGSMEVHEETTLTASIGQTICDRIIRDKYRDQRLSSGKCHWHYTCDFDFNRFPRAVVEAELNETATELYDRSLCNEERVRGVTHFVRVPCPEDPCGRTTWGVRYGNSVNIGYRYRS